MIPLCIPYINEEEEKLMVDALRSGWLAHGPYNKKFEEKFKNYIGVDYAITLNSCTSALFLALIANNIKGEVILPSFTFVASANAVVTAGAKCKFADIDYNTCNLTAATIEKEITDNTEAIMLVHYAGQSCDMPAIEALAKKHNLFIIEDSAETIGGTCNGIMTGSKHTGCFSFFPTKNITTGEGGMYTTNCAEEADRVKTILAHGISSTTFAREKERQPWLRAATYAGYNFRMSNVLAAIGTAQMDKLDKMNNRRIQIAAQYNKGLECKELDLPIELENNKHVYQMYTIKLNNLDRNVFIKELRDNGIGASVHFDPPVHLQPYYQTNYNIDKLPVTEKVAANIVTLPIYPGMTDSDVSTVVKEVKNAIVKSRK